MERKESGFVEGGRMMFTKLTTCTRFGQRIKGFSLLAHDFDLRECKILGTVVDRLATYEDTGLTPDQIEAQQQEIEQLKDRNVTYVNENANQAKEIERLNEALDDWKHEAECDFDYIATLIADKDEQAGRIMRMEEGLRHAKADLQVAQNFSHPNGFKTIRKAINSIDALLGG